MAMRSIWMVARKGILKRKTYTIAIFFLTAVAAVCMATALSTIFHTQEIYDTAYQKSHSPDIFYAFWGKSYSPDDLSFFKQRPEVEDAVAQPCLYGVGTVGSLNGQDLSACVFAAYDPSANDYALSDTEGALTDHSAYLPLLYKSQFNAKTGDSILIKTAEGNVSFTVAGFFEDPVYGSAFMGTKQILLSAGGYREMESLTQNRTTAAGVNLNVYLKPAYQGTVFGKTAETVNQTFGRDTLATFQADRLLFRSAVLIIPRIISVVLLCFSVLLLLVTIFVLRHAILSSIEADYVSLGVLKAFGFTRTNILASVLVQYLTVAAGGAAAGVVAAVFATPGISGVLMASTGILGNAGLTAPAALGTTAALLLLCGCIAGVTARRAAKVSPMRAIAFGKAPVQFSSRLNPSLARLHSLPLWLSLPIKQMTTRIRQYATLIVVAALFTFMLATLEMMTANFSSVEKMARILGLPLYDLDVVSASPALCPPEKLDGIVGDISRTYGVKRVDWTDYQSLRVDGFAVTGAVWSSFDEQKDAVLSGSLPELDNEVAITPLISRMLGKGVGDSVVVRKGDSQQSYMITCILQSISEMGKVIELNAPGYRRIAPDYQPTARSLVLNDNSDVPGVIAALKQKYPSASGVSFSNDKTNLYNIFSTVQMATGLASAVVLLLTLLLIACITLLLCTITVYREFNDTGIFKAVGFRTRELRLQFTLRFVLVSVLGSFFGIALSLLFAKTLIGAALSSMGIASLPAVWSFATLGFPLLFVMCTAGLTAFLCSAKIRRISPVRLVNE